MMPRSARERGSALMLRHRLHILMFALLAVCAAAHATAQAQQPPEQVPVTQATFDGWVAQGLVEQIPWRPRAYYVGLSGHQRLVAQIDVDVPIRELLRRPREGRISLLVEVADSLGHKYGNFGVLNLSEIQEEGKKDDMRSSWRAFVLPGEYHVTLALYHSATGEHNLAQRTLVAPRLAHDPLPQAWRNLPAVEFLAPIPGSDLDFFFRPDLSSRLYLPLATQQPVQVHILADFTTSDLFGGSHFAYLHYLSAVLPTLKTFSQIEVARGSVDVATLNLTEQQVSFEQRDVKDLDWPRLKKTLAGLDPGRISAHTLAAKHLTPALLKKEVARRGGASGTGNSDDPLQVFIVITSPLGVYSFRGMSDDPLPGNCHCVLYYVQYETSRRQVYFEAAGSVKKMFRPLKVHSFTGHNALDLRRALSVILDEVSRM